MSAPQAGRGTSVFPVSVLLLLLLPLLLMPLAAVFVFGAAYLPWHLEHEGRPAQEAPRFWPGMVLFMGSMAGRGPMLSWVAMHRRHHELSDHDGDLHSPNLHGDTVLGRLRGFLHAHLT